MEDYIQAKASGHTQEPELTHEQSQYRLQRKINSHKTLKY